MCDKNQDQPPTAREMTQEEQARYKAARQMAEAKGNLLGIQGAGAGYSPESLRSRLDRAAREKGDECQRLYNLSSRMTPEIEETISVLKEAIKLGVVHLHGGIERY